MAFTPARSNLNFQAPQGGALPLRQAPDISGGLDSLFSQYMQMKQGQRLDTQDAIAAEQRTNVERDRQGSNLLQYGFDPRQVTPEVMSRASMPTPQGPAMPGQPSPEQAENPLFGAVRAFMDKKKSAAGMAVSGAQLEQDKTRSGIVEDAASARLKNATAGLYEQGRGLPGEDGPEIVTKDGQQFIVNRDAKGNKRYSANPGSQIQSEIGTKVGLSQDGMDNLDYIEQVLRSPEGQKLALKAGGDFDRLKSFNDPAAEKLANAILQAGDAEARVKTGASYNENELRDYFKKLVNPVGTMEGNLDRIARKKAFFGGQLKIYGQGRNIPGREAAGGKIRVSNGRATLLIDAADEADAAKDGYARAK